MTKSISTLVLEKLTVAKILKKFPTCYENTQVHGGKRPHLLPLPSQ